MQVELNRQLQRQIIILQDKVELIRGNLTDKLAIVRIFDQMPVAYHKANDERRMYLSEILQTSAVLKTVERQKTDALTSNGEKQTLRGRCSVPQRLKMVNPPKRPIKKTAGVMQLPKLKL
uniref:Uncharacterized protein n=1 Tax=Chrysolophus pictus TaxID=9089 RepID=A0A8C3L4W8_CHRPC